MSRALAAALVLFNPAEYTHLAAHTFTPLLLLWFKFDLAMVGLRPIWFYGHQVLTRTQVQPEGEYVWRQPTTAPVPRAAAKRAA